MWYAMLNIIYFNLKKKKDGTQISNRAQLGLTTFPSKSYVLQMIFAPPTNVFALPTKGGHRHRRILARVAAVVWEEVPCTRQGSFKFPPNCYVTAEVQSGLFLDTFTAHTAFYLKLIRCQNWYLSSGETNIFPYYFILLYDLQLKWSNYSKLLWIKSIILNIITSCVPFFTSTIHINAKVSQSIVSLKKYRLLRFTTHQCVKWSLL